MAWLAHAAAAALKRLDTLAAAALAGSCAGALAQARLCDDASCSSGRDAVVHAAAVLLGAAAAALLLRRAPLRGWGRAAVLAVAVYAAAIVPPLVRARGRWTLPTPAGACEVRAGAPRADVRGACGEPSTRCAGPRFAERARWWDPFAHEVCGLRGDVYGDRLVVYGCGGLVSRVDAFGGAGPGRCAPAR